jgi:hypothetical protein
MEAAIAEANAFIESMGGAPPESQGAASDSVRTGFHS